MKFHCSIEFGGENVEVGAQFIVNDVNGTAEDIAKDMGLVKEMNESYSLNWWYKVSQQLVLNLNRALVYEKLYKISNMYRVVQKSWCQVARIVQPVYSQPRPAMPGWCLTKQSLFYAQLCTYRVFHSYCIF